MPERRNKVRYCTFVCVVTVMTLMSRVAPAEQSIVAHEAFYKVKISVLGGTMRTTVTETEYGFAAKSVIKPAGFARLVMHGSIEERSEFTVGTDGIRPRHYDSSDTLSRKDKFMSFDFDWANERVSGKINDQDFAFEFDGEVHDRVSIQYELMYNLLNGTMSYEYALLDGDKLKQLQITNIGTKTIETPFGKFEAIGIQHRARNSSRVSTLWCAEVLGYLPVLIEQHRDGKRRVRAVLTHYARLEPGSLLGY